MFDILISAILITVICGIINLFTDKKKHDFKDHWHTSIENDAVNLRKSNRFLKNRIENL